jgi:arsenite-transporting ATPase
MNEANGLQEDLNGRAVPYAWIINQSLSMRNDITDPLLKSRAMAELDVIKKIKHELASQTFGIPYLAQEDLLPALLNFCENPVLQMSTMMGSKDAQSHKS